MKRKVVLYIAMSLDGYIAKKDHNIEFLTTVEIPGEDFGYSDFLKNIDTIIWGRKTFDKVLSFGIDLPHKDKNVYVVSRTRTGNHAHAVYHDDVVQLVTGLKEQEGKDIYCDGGSEIVWTLLRHSLIDTMVISVIPYLLGDGIRLFKDERPEQHLQFRKSITYPSGLVQLWYDKRTGQ